MSSSMFVSPLSACMFISLLFACIFVSPLCVCLYVRQSPFACMFVSPLFVRQSFVCLPVCSSVSCLFASHYPRVQHASTAVMQPLFLSSVCLFASLYNNTLQLYVCSPVTYLRLQHASTSAVFCCCCFVCMSVRQSLTYVYNMPLHLL